MGISKNNGKLESSKTSAKTRFRMYKSGKMWLVAGAAFFAFGTFAVTNVSADTTSAATTAASTYDASSSATITQTVTEEAQDTPTIDGAEAQPVNAPSGTTDQTNTRARLKTT